MRLFTAAELAVLRASDRVVDQQEPGGALYRRDRNRMKRRRVAVPATGPQPERGLT